VGRKRVKPATGADGEVKPTRRLPATNIQPASGSAGLTYRTAVCGPACTVVWEGRGREASPYPDFKERERGIPGSGLTSQFYVPPFPLFAV
jgi:hypothetical protein